MHVKQNHARDPEQDASGSMSYHHHHYFLVVAFIIYLGVFLFIIKGTELLVFFCFLSFLFVSVFFVGAYVFGGIFTFVRLDIMAA